MVTSKNVKKIGFLATIFILAALTFNYVVATDKYKAQIESYVVNNQEFSQTLGEVNKVKIVKITIVQASGTEKPYRKYKVRVFGSKDKAVFDIRISDLDKVGNETIEVLK